ncbi:MAG: esterase-like activity of phytase family protein [Pseudobdellovibrionaceae bacterium]
MAQLRCPTAGQVLEKIGPEKEIQSLQLDKISLLFVMIFCCWPFSVSAEEITLKYFAHKTIDSEFTFKKSLVGGLSAIVYKDGKIFTLSDDRGKEDVPRFFVWNFSVAENKINIQPTNVVYLENESEKKLKLDSEGLARWNGALLFSTEGDMNKKPRIQPGIFTLSLDGKIKTQWPLPEKFLANPSGIQKTGVFDNRGFEGLTSTPDEKFVFAITESALITDYDKDHEQQWIRIIKYDQKGKVLAEYPYLIKDSIAESDKKKEKDFFRGVSEILAVSEHQLLVMERGVRLSLEGIKKTVSIYLLDLNHAEDVSKVARIPDMKKNPSVNKRLLFDLEKDLPRDLEDFKNIENFEGMAWGPVLDGQKKSILLVSDNNFSKKEKTQFVILSLQVQP